MTAKTLAKLNDNVKTLEVVIPRIKAANLELAEIAAQEKALRRRRRDAEAELTEALRIMTTTQARNTME